MRIGKGYKMDIHRILKYDHGSIPLVMKEMQPKPELHLGLIRSLKNVK